VVALSIEKLKWTRRPALVASNQSLATNYQSLSTGHGPLVAIN